MLYDVGEEVSYGIPIFRLEKEMGPA